jgi:hypothetical protein
LIRARWVGPGATPTGVLMKLSTARRALIVPLVRLG